MCKPIRVGVTQRRNLTITVLLLLKEIPAWPPAGTRRRGRCEMKWENEAERVMKKRSVTFNDAINRQIWRRETDNQ